MTDPAAILGAAPRSTDMKGRSVENHLVLGVLVVGTIMASLVMYQRGRLDGWRAACRAWNLPVGDGTTDDTAAMQRLLNRK